MRYGFSGPLQDLAPEHGLALKCGPVSGLEWDIDVVVGLQEKGHLRQYAADGEFHEIGVYRWAGDVGRQREIFL